MKLQNFTSMIHQIFHHIENYGAASKTDELFLTKSNVHTLHD